MRGLTDNKKTQDRIDLELSRTYFGTTTKDKDYWLGNEFQKETPIIFHLKKRLPSAAISIVVLCLLVFSGYLLKEKIVQVSINIKPSKNIKKSSVQLKNKKSFFAKHIFSRSKTFYDFEKNKEGWEIPSWTLEKDDYVAETLKIAESPEHKDGSSIELYSKFPGDTWTAALCEIEHFLDLNKFDLISADIYLPANGPAGLKGKLIVTTGENWHFTEMSRAFKITPGKWTTITANIADGSIDWRGIKVNSEFRKDVRKISVRIESDKITYTGPVYIDNIRGTSRKHVYKF
ncbi:MAG: hypothetical protein ABH869_06770 [Candidatus Omnitrophota bacterium]